MSLVCGLFLKTRIAYGKILIIGKMFLWAILGKGGDSMKNNWKRLCFLLCGVVLLESAYLVWLKSDASADRWKSTAVYYGNSGKAEVELTATRDFMQMKNLIDESEAFSYPLSFKLENNGDTYLVGTVYLFSAPEMEKGEAEICITSDKKTSASTNLWKMQRTESDPVQEWFFYLEGTDALEIDEIRRCTISYGKETVEVDLELLEMNEWK